ncbi:MAG: hypothetical protein AAGJ37_13550, partial [Pseudomonadota bacterium]
IFTENYMLFETYANNSELCNVSVNGATSQDGKFAFRGDMVIVDGDIADAQGRRHPPKVTLKQAVALSTQDALSMVAGAVDDVADIKSFVAKYDTDLSENTALLFYAANISKSLKVNVDGKTVTVIPHDDGAVWTLMMDDLCLEKSDFKGQSAEDKVITMYDALLDFSPRFDEVEFDEALSFITEVKREMRGAV